MSTTIERSPVMHDDEQLYNQMNESLRVAYAYAHDKERYGWIRATMINSIYEYATREGLTEFLIDKAVDEFNKMEEK